MRLPQINFELGQYAEACNACWKEFCDDTILARILDQDFTVWRAKPAEINNRLGWLDCTKRYRTEIPGLQAFATQVREDGVTQVVLLGMGGSSLGAGALAEVFGSASGYPELTVLDTTHPQAIRDVMAGLDLKHSLFVVATKSGSTVETLSLFKYCYNQLGNALGYDNAGQHFIAITDAGSPLGAIAKQCAFRQVFLNDPHIGGRYSVLSYFGLVPAALLGLNLDSLLDSAEAMANLDNQAVESVQGGAYLGIVLGALANQGRDKLTVVCDQQLAALGPWLEQLIAESNGKRSRGILPILADEPAPPDSYGEDMSLVVIEVAGEGLFNAAAEKLTDAGIPVIRISLPDIQSLGAEFFRWQMATACLCHVIGVNPFDQPDVDSAKQATRNIVKAGTQHGKPDCQNIYEALSGLLKGIGGANYIAVLAYLNPCLENIHLLNQLCVALSQLTPAPVSLSFGPRYLHSTGQLHKGGMAGGRYLIITADSPADLAIPDEHGEDSSSLTFGALINAQAWGDETALLEAGRAVNRIHLGNDPKISLQLLLDALDDS